MSLPTPTEGRLSWFVRESVAVTHDRGRPGLRGPSRTTRSQLRRRESDSLVVFGDGMEDDRLTLGSAANGSTIRRAARVLRTVA